MSTRKMFVVPAVVVAAVLMSGCGAVRRLTQENPNQIVKFEPTLETIVTPERGKAASASVGAAMSSYFVGLTTREIAVSDQTPYEEMDGDGDGFKMVMPAGKFRAVSSDKRGSIFFGTGVNVIDAYENHLFDKKKNALVDYKVLPDGTVHGLWVYLGDNDLVEFPLKGLKYSVAVVPLDDARSFSRELVYTGRSGNSISVLYREFKNDMARPAFSQTLQYDLGSTDVIGYRGARFKVLAADNTKIDFEVLAPLGALDK